jgi:hypothetical protein
MYPWRTRDFVEMSACRPTKRLKSGCFLTVLGCFFAQFWHEFEAVLGQGSGIRGQGPGIRDQGSEKDGGSGFVVSHSSTIKLWMSGAQMFLVIL